MFVHHDIPDYFNGTLKVIGVAATVGSVGSIESNVLVQSDFIINPNLPLFVAPNDEFIAPITIANNVLKSGNAKVNINIETDEGLQILSYPQTIVIAENQENHINVRLKATNKLGTAIFKVTASLNDINSEITTSTSIRPALANITTVDTGYEPRKIVDLKIERNLYPEFSKLQISAASSPLAIISGFKSYLDNYPFNSTEQIVSQNFVNIMLYNAQDLVKLLKSDRQKMDKSLSYAFQTLSERQNYDGGFNNWTNNNYNNSSNNFVSIYAMHFLTESNARYLAVPSNIFSLGLEYLKNIANRTITSLNDAREKAYAIYVLTRNNEITTHYIANILNYLNTYHKDSWYDDLTAVYLAASYKMLKMPEEADNLLTNFNLSKPIDTKILNYQYYSPLIKYSQYLYLISLHFVIAKVKGTTKLHEKGTREFGVT